MDWSDRHCRFFFRQLSPHALVYTEMITTGALIHGDVARHLDFNQAERPAALQLGGSEPAELALSAKLGESWGYDEINLNCGCPSERVQRGAFGACLMAEPKLVADCVRAMQDAVPLPVTVKHRLGIDSVEEYDFARRFVETLAAAGCRTFIVHARNAVLKGLSPKDNRQIPPLKYNYVYRLKADFPECDIVINGGIVTVADALRHLDQVDGVMLGRAAYQNPYVLAQVDQRFYGAAKNTKGREQVLLDFMPYVEEQLNLDVPLNHISRHILGLFQKVPGAKLFRRHISENAHKKGAGIEVLQQALQLLRTAQNEAEASAAQTL